MSVEENLINELIKLICKSGGETFVGNFQRTVNEDQQPERWTESELKEAVQYIRYINEYFGRDEAVAIITALLGKYNLSIKDLALGQPSASEKIKLG
jgi:hypothetical protein